MPKILTEDLLEGMILSEYIPTILGSSLEKGKTLTLENITLLKNSGIKELFVDSFYTLDISPNDSIARELKYFINYEIRRLAPQKKAATSTDTIVQNSATAIETLNRIISNKTVINLCVEMKLNSKKLYKHSIISCAHSLLLASTLGLGFQEIENIGIAALLHDIGMKEMSVLVGKKDKNDQEERLYKEHPIYGYYLALEEGLSEDIAVMIKHHHELWEGMGFPENLKAENIPLGSRIITICESYDTLVRFDKLPLNEAIEYLYGAGGYYYQTDIVHQFFENLAVYPLGSLVRLTTGEVGVVVNVRDNPGPRPLVRLFFNKFNKKLASPIDIDLSQERTIFIKELL